MTLKKALYIGIATVLGIVAICFAVQRSAANERNEADDLVRFTANGVWVRVIKTNTFVESHEYNPFETDSERAKRNAETKVHLSTDFRIENENGETRTFTLCDGHPDHDGIVHAAPDSKWNWHGYRIRFIRRPVYPEDLRKPCNLGFARFLRVVRVGSY